MDGLQGLQNGPGTNMTLSLEADQMNMRVILAGAEPVAIDTIEALCMTWDPQTVNHLVYFNDDSAGNLDTACITVKGVQVVDIGKDFEGRPPVIGGLQFSDLTPPSLSVNSSRFEDGTCDLSLSVGSDTVKVEVHVDGSVLDPVITGSYGSITIDIRSIAGGSHVAEVYVYDDTYNESSSNQPVTLQTGTLMGFGVAYNDNDSGTEREHMIGSMDIPGVNKNIAWQDASVFGALELVDPESVSTEPVPTTPAGVTPVPGSRGDVDSDCDGEIDIIDALLIVQYYVDLITEFPC
jgi:hypothetical protein